MTGMGGNIVVIPGSPRRPCAAYTHVCVGERRKLFPTDDGPRGRGIRRIQRTRAVDESRSRTFGRRRFGRPVRNAARVATAQTRVLRRSDERRGTRPSRFGYRDAGRSRASARKRARFNMPGTRTRRDGGSRFTAIREGRGGHGPRPSL